MDCRGQRCIDNGQSRLTGQHWKHCGDQRGVFDIIEKKKRIGMLSEVAAKVTSPLFPRFG